jgi:hypothetical protein
MVAILLAAVFAIDDRSAPKHESIDGDWTIMCLEKDGQPVPNAKNITVHIQNNVATFKCPEGTADKDKVRSMRIRFGHHGTVHVTEANADGKFEQAETGGAGAATAAPPAGNAGGGTAGEHHGAKTGVYVLTHDYFALCVHHPMHAAAGGAGGAGGAAGQAGAAGGAAGSDVKPMMKTHCAVVLKRTSGSGTSP